MDYYSGAPEPSDYDFDNDGNVSGGNFFKNYSFFLLLGIAAVVAVFIVIFFLTSGNSSPEYDKKDKNSYLKSLIIYGGTIEPSFEKEIYKYNVVTSSGYVTLDWELDSDKSEAECELIGNETISVNCEDSIDVDDERVEYDIKITAEDGNVTRYHFYLKKVEETEVE